jgi:hypothetical protein
MMASIIVEDRYTESSYERDLNLTKTLAFFVDPRKYADVWPEDMPQENVNERVSENNQANVDFDALSAFIEKKTKEHNAR